MCGILAYILDCNIAIFVTAHLKISFLQFYLRQLATLWLQYFFAVSSCVTGVCVCVLNLHLGCKYSGFSWNVSVNSKKAHFMTPCIQ